MVTGNYNGSYVKRIFLKKFSRNKEMSKTSLCVVPRRFPLNLSKNPRKPAIYKGGFLVSILQTAHLWANTGVV